jgi:hypothetical protein
LQSALLIFQIPLLQQFVPFWFWHLHVKPAGLPWYPAIYAVATAFVLLLLHRERKIPAFLILTAFILTAYLLQLALAFQEGRKINGMRDRIVTTGHAEFAVKAAELSDAGDLLRNYEMRVHSGTLGDFAPSKPPGQLLFYYGSQRISDLLHPSAAPADRLANARTFAAWFWPLFSFLFLPALYCLTKQLRNADAALSACALTLFVPSLQLITLHLDQVLYPLLVLLTALAFRQAAQRQSLPAAVLGGVLLYFSLFVSFSLAAALPVFAACLLPDSNQKRWSRLLLNLAAAALGFATAAVLVYLLWSYDPLLRWHEALHYHAQWKGSIAGFEDVMRTGFCNLLEFFLWLGIPLSAAALGGLMAVLWRDARAKTLSSESALALGCLCALLGAAFLSQTRAETARLWIFFVPLLCIFAALYFENWEGKPKRALFSLVLVLQMTTLYLTKTFQDFW